MRVADGAESRGWALGCTCGKCRRRIVLFRDSGNGRGPIEAPLRGEFGFACPYCSSDNTINTRELVRFQLDSGAQTDGGLAA